MLATLRQPRYLGLFGLMLVLAVICGAAGTWQTFRFEQKRNANHHLRADNGVRPADIAAALGPASKPTATGNDQKFRHVTASGTYLDTKEILLRDQTINGNLGYLVITPLRTSTGVLLVARGFVAQTGAAETSPNVPAAPSGPVTVTARLEPAEDKADRLGQLPGHQVETVNPALQATRIGAPVWNGYAELLSGQPGTSGLTVIPAPDLSNPAGGAEVPQHAAYVVQWYLFALLALAAPFIMARAERRRDEAPDRPGAPPRPTAPEGSKPVSDGTKPVSKARPVSKAKQKKASLDDRLAGRT